MRPIFTFALTAVLTITFASCGKAQETINQEARMFKAPFGDYVCDILSDSVDISRIFTEEYFDSDPEYLDLLSLRSILSHCVWYSRCNQTARAFTDYYNAMIIYHNLISDSETAQRFGEDDSKYYTAIADAIATLDVLDNIISNDTLRTLISQVAEKIEHYVRHSCTADTEPINTTIGKIFEFLNTKLNPIFENSREAYLTYDSRKPFFKDFDSIIGKRGTSDKAYQQELLTKLYLAKTPAERHVYALEFAHSDSTNAYFIIGAAVLNREFVDTKLYSPYLSEMWRAWRASISSMFGQSSWSYIPNELYNDKRKQAADIIINYIEANPDDVLAQGVLIDLAGIDNISRHGSYFGNASILEQMTMFPEWDKSKRIVK